MYPGTAANKNIPARKTETLQFKESEDGKNILSPALIIPAVNISETTKEYFITLAASGLRREDFSIEIANSVITISAKKEIIPLSCINDRIEYDYTDWTRAFALPVDADALLAHAEFHDGELIIHIPRNKPVENQGKAIIYVY